MFGNLFTPFTPFSAPPPFYSRFLVRPAIPRPSLKRPLVDAFLHDDWDSFEDGLILLSLLPRTKRQRLAPNSTGSDPIEGGQSPAAAAVEPKQLLHSSAPARVEPPAQSEPAVEPAREPVEQQQEGEEEEEVAESPNGNVKATAESNAVIMRVEETAAAWLVKSTWPGYDKAHLRVDVSDDGRELLIEGERQEEQRDEARAGALVQRSVAVSRRLPLPPRVDLAAIRAAFQRDSATLIVTLPKLHPDE